MFSTHRPKIYRSRMGCCICGAKSSSSRFTSSSKYEQHFKGCFVLSEKREGEICNACVLLVKRWSKLPQGSNKNWKHVVDSKASVKRCMRPRRASKAAAAENEDRKCLKRGGNSTSVKDKGSETVDANDNIEEESDCPSPPSLSCASPSPPPSDISEESGSYNTPSEITKSTSSTACQTSFLYPSLKSSTTNKLPYIDLSLWRQEEICCGMIFKGPCGEVLVDPKLLNPFCSCSTSQTKTNGFIPNKNSHKIPV